jgi:hypothetical protein
MSFAGGPLSDDQTKPLFEQGFTQMAYNVLMSKLPHIGPDVVTFKIINSDPSTGSAVGTFILRRQGETLYIPVVMADNQLKPLDILYYRDMNVFVPLTKDWLSQVDKASMSEMGYGTRLPPTVNSDVDIRRAIVPPVTGRFSYASDSSAAVVFDQARAGGSSSRPSFLEFMRMAPNQVKKAAARVFEQNPKLLKTAVWHYGANSLVHALEVLPEKTASHYLPNKGGALFVADETVSPDQFRAVFGPRAAIAFQNVIKGGYAANDTRTGLNRPVKVSPYMLLTEPDAPGAYEFVSAEGKQVKALVFPSHLMIFRHSTDGMATRFGKAPPDRGGATCPTPLVIFEDGQAYHGNLPVGEKLELGALNGTQLLNKFTESGGEPVVGGLGIFVRIDSRGMSATDVVRVRSVANDSDGVRRVTVTKGDGYSDPMILLTDTNSRTGSLIVPPGDRVAHLPASYKFLPVSSMTHTSPVIGDSRAIERMVSESLTKEGAEQHVVRFSPANGWTVNGGNRGSLKIAGAIEKLARDANIHADEAAVLVKEAAQSGRATFFSVPAKGLGRVRHKLAAAQQSPMEPSMMDPNMQAQMAAAQPPPMPSPVDMAVAEQTQSIMGQMQALQQQLQMLQSVQSRSQQIATGGGAAGAPAAAAAAMGGPMPMGPQPVPQMGMDPNAMQMQQQGMMDPNAMQMQQQGAMDPNAMQMQGMDPNAMQMQQQGAMDPNAAQQSPMAMMTADDGSIESVQNQINPQFLEQAASLQDSGIFDAAALASMAQAPSLKELTAAYIPNLEKALDNLGRVLLTLYMDESRIKADLGVETFLTVEENLRNTFKGLGELLLKINQSTVILRGPYEPEYRSDL